jgi:hypothetical protein
MEDDREGREGTKLRGVWLSWRMIERGGRVHN